MEVDIKKVKDVVKSMLENNEHSRNSDTHLATLIWREECERLNITDLNPFLFAFSNGDLTHFESIRRCRAKWQEEYPELRGDNYKERKAKESIIVGDLTTLFR
jgi:hypothetical protein